MGLFNSYGPSGADAVQLKASSKENRTLAHFNLGDHVDIKDGIYIGLNGVVVIYDSILVAHFTHKHGSFPGCFYNRSCQRLTTFASLPTDKSAPDDTMYAMADVGDGIFIGSRGIIVVYNRQMVSYFEEQAGIFPTHLYDKFGNPWSTSEMATRYTD